MNLSAGIIPVRKYEGTWQFLLLRCFKYWDFPKGEIGQNENPLKAAIREVLEETAIHNLVLRWGEEFYETEPYSKVKIARYYLGEVTSDTEVKLLPNPENGIIEHHEYRWVNFEEGQKLTNPRITKVLKWAFGRLNTLN